MLPFFPPILYLLRDTDFEKSFGTLTHNGDASAQNNEVLGLQKMRNSFLMAKELLAFKGLCYVELVS